MLPLNPLKVFAILAISIAAGVCCVPYPAASQQNETNDRHLTYVVLELEVDDLLQKWIETISHDVRHILSEEKIAYTDLQSSPGEIRVTLRDEAQVKSALEKCKPLIGSTKEVLVFPGVPDMDITSDSNTIVFKLTKAGIADRVSETVYLSAEILRQQSTERFTVQRYFTNKLRLETTGAADEMKAEANAFIERTASLSFQFVDDTMTPEQAQRSGVPSGSALYSGRKGITYLLHNTSILTGAHIAEVDASFEPLMNMPAVHFGFDAVGTQRFAVATRDNVGKAFAIVLNGEVISAPIISEPIVGGRGLISGGLSVQEAHEVAMRMRYAAYQPKWKIIQDITVRDPIPQGQPQ